ncbi:MAG: cytochrome B [Comamonadaceae bacterium]|nr:cytochrome B [Comamonadaceae bacterium]
MTLGYTLGGLVVFRLVWGLVGTRHARFGELRAPGRRAVLRYLTAVAAAPARAPRRPQPGRRAGDRRHARAGRSCSAAAAGPTATGARRRLARGRARTAPPTLFMATGAGARRRRRPGQRGCTGENLRRAAMVDGPQAGARRPSAIRSSWRTVGVLMLAAVLGFWALQWQGAPSAAAPDADRLALDGRDRQGGDRDQDDGD